jgi:hypothetical protein
MCFLLVVGLRVSDSELSDFEWLCEEWPDMRLLGKREQIKSIKYIVFDWLLIYHSFIISIFKPNCPLNCTFYT